MCSGHPVEPHGINSEGMRRRGFSSEEIAAVKRAYKAIYRQNRLTASYMHVYFPSNPLAVGSLMNPGG